VYWAEEMEKLLNNTKRVEIATKEEVYDAVYEM
jgi:hypothetical protein